MPNKLGLFLLQKELLSTFHCITAISKYWLLAELQYSFTPIQNHPLRLS